MVSWCMLFLRCIASMLLGSTVMESWCAHFCVASTLWGVKPSWCMLFLCCIASVLLTSTAMESCGIMCHQVTQHEVLEHEVTEYEVTEHEVMEHEVLESWNFHGIVMESCCMDSWNCHGAGGTWAVLVLLYLTATPFLQACANMSCLVTTRAQDAFIALVVTVVGVVLLLCLAGILYLSVNQLGTNRQDNTRVVISVDNLRIINPPVVRVQALFCHHPLCGACASTSVYDAWHLHSVYLARQLHGNSTHFLQKVVFCSRVLNRHETSNVQRLTSRCPSGAISVHKFASRCPSGPISVQKFASRCPSGATSVHKFASRCPSGPSPCSMGYQELQSAPTSSRCFKTSERLRALSCDRLPVMAKLNRLEPSRGPCILRYSACLVPWAIRVTSSP
eukprot:1138943-Pelagomonas_calceolata.AAC.2